MLLLSGFTPTRALSEMSGQLGDLLAHDAFGVFDAQLRLTTLLVEPSRSLVSAQHLRFWIGFVWVNVCVVHVWVWRAFWSLPSSVSKE